MENDFNKKVFIVKANYTDQLEGNVNKKLEELEKDFRGDGYSISLHGTVVAHQPSNRVNSEYIQTILVTKLL